MSEILIVGKTIKGNKKCVGGLDLSTGRGVRLLNAKGEDQPSNTPFEVGGIWKLQWQELSRAEVSAPHTEDIRVVESQFKEQLTSSEQIVEIERCYDIPVVHPHELFDERLTFTSSKRAYISPSGSIPTYSTGFWRFDRGLYKCVNQYRKIRYAYCDDDSSCDLDDDDMELDVSFVGCADPIHWIPAGVILRFSLSGWYRVPRTNTAGFWLQLSGWFL